jgi:dihydrofolate reductase
MRKLVESTFSSMDGVIGNPQEWGVPYWDEEHTQYNRDLLFGADALVLGRQTYEAFAQAWPSRPRDDYVDRINDLPKYVASRTLTDEDTTWNASIVQGDVPDGVKALKAQPGQSLLKYGTGELDRTLLANGLLDELHLWVFPVVAGGGQRLLEGLDLTHLHLADSTRFASGIVVNVYTPK